VCLKCGALVTIHSSVACLLPSHGSESLLTHDFFLPSDNCYAVPSFRLARMPTVDCKARGRQHVLNGHNSAAAGGGYFWTMRHPSLWR